VADKGIIFSAAMVRALLDGRKTQTRRLLKGAPKGDWHCDQGAVGLRWVAGPGAPSMPCRVPYAVADRLYVRESGIEYPGVAGGSDLFRHDVPAESERGHYWVRDRLGVGASYSVKGCSRAAALAGGRRKVRPSIHMPRWASRMWLAVTDVRVQRLQECSEADAIAEGIERIDDPRGTAWKSYETYADGKPHPHAVVPNRSPLTSYAELWNSLHTAECERWQDNPWVVAVSFEVHLGNIDAKDID
jgi:hypothetical protein